MSIRLMTLVWDIPFPTQAQKLIALKLADYASDDGGSVFPARDTIADKVGCGESTVKRTLRAFRDCGLLHLIREGGGARSSTNEWLINVQMLKALAEGECMLAGGADELLVEGEVPCAEPVDVGGAILTPLNDQGGPSKRRGGPPATGRGATSGPQLTNNHQLEPSCAREGSCEAGATPSRALKPAPSITLTRKDVSWPDWVSSVDLATAERLERAGEFVATSRWPSKEARIISIANAPVNITARMLGEAAK